MLADKTNMEEAATYYSRSSRSLKRFFSLQDGNRKKIKSCRRRRTTTINRKRNSLVFLQNNTFKHSASTSRSVCLLQCPGSLLPPEAGRHKTPFSSFQTPKPSTSNTPVRLHPSQVFQTGFYGFTTDMT